MANSCPDCGSPLTVVSDPNGRVLLCRSCGGHLYGLSPFERMLPDGVGARVWTGAAEGSPGGACPYCSVPMRHPDADADAPGGLAVCRTCQEIWVPASADEWMAGQRPDSVAPVAAAPPEQCSNCGAPYQPDEDGRCHWCHAQIAAPQPVLVVMQQEPVADTGFRLF